MDDLSDDSDISNLPQTGKSKQRVLLPPTSGALAELSDGSDVDLHSGKELPNHKFYFNFVETGARGRQSAAAKASDALFGTGCSQVLRQKVRRLEGKLQATLGNARAQLQSVKTFWDRGKLRRADRLNATLCPGRQRRRVWRHKREWHLAGVIYKAFQTLGNSCGGNDARETRRELDALAATVFSHQRFIKDNVTGTFMSFTSGAVNPFFLGVNRAIDGTPITVRFGCVHDMVAPVARYWFPAYVVAKHGKRYKQTSLPTHIIPCIRWKARQ